MIDHEEAAAAQHQMVPNNCNDPMMNIMVKSSQICQVPQTPVSIIAQNNEGSSKMENLNHLAYQNMDLEAEVEGVSEISDLNRAVSEILKNRKSDPDDVMSKKRRQRLTYE